MLETAVLLQCADLCILKANCSNSSVVLVVVARHLINRLTVHNTGMSQCVQRVLCVLAVHNTRSRSAAITLSNIHYNTAMLLTISSTARTVRCSIIADVIALSLCTVNRLLYCILQIYAMIQADSSFGTAQLCAASVYGT